MCLKGFSLDGKVDRLRKAETLIYVIINIVVQMVEYTFIGEVAGSNPVDRY